MNKKNILMIYQDWGNWIEDNYSKFEFWFKNLDGAYDKNNEYYFLVFSNQNKIIKPEKNITVEFIKSTPLKQFLDLYKYNKRVKQLIKQFNPQYVYSPFIYLLSTVPKSNNYKIIGFVRDKTAQMVKANKGIKSYGGNIFYLLDYLSFKKIDLVLHNGKTMEKYAKKMGFKGKCIYVPRPISDKENVVYKKDKNLIEKHNLKGKKVILTVARLTAEKNLKMGIEALRYLPKNYIHLIVGEGEEKSLLEILIKKYDLEDRVKLVGFIHRKDIWRYYSITDVFWLLSSHDFEGTPNVLQETLYAKIPCVVSKIPAMKNIITNNKTGIILDAWESKELSNKTLELVKNKIDYKKIQENGYKHILSILKKNKKVSEFFK